MDNSIKMDLFTVLLLIRVMLRNIFNESLYFTNFACLPLSLPNDCRKLFVPAAEPHPQPSLLPASPGWGGLQ